MQARGKTREILKLVGEIQNLVGSARMFHGDDKNPDGFALAQQQLEKAHDLCIKIRGMYDPV